MGDITRDQFRESVATLRKVFQRDRMVPDADLNEIGQIALIRNARTLYRVLDAYNVRFGSGWGITGGTNSTTISAGDAAIQIDANHSYLISLASNAVINDWTTPSSGSRTDYIYLDVEFDEVNSTEDSYLINPSAYVETAIDIRLKYTISHQQGGTFPTAPAGHYYVQLASISRSQAKGATINLSDISTSWILWSPTVNDILYVQPLEALAADAVISDWSTGTTGDYTSCFVSSQTLANTYQKKLRVPFVKKSAWTKVRAIYERLNNVINTTTGVRFTIDPLTAVESAAGEAPNSWHTETQDVDISSLTANALYTILMEMKSDSQSQATYYVGVRKMIILGTQ